MAENKTQTEEIEITDKDRNKKKRSGCSCCLFGCFGLILLMLLPIIGGFVYLSTLDEAVFGEKIIMILKHPSFSEAIRKGIQENENLDTAQEKILLNFYDQLLSEYDKLPKEKQTIIDRNIVITIKKALMGPEDFRNNPPEEFREILKILGFPGLDSRF